MTVNELIQELQKIPEDMRNLDIMCYAGSHSVKDLSVYFEETTVSCNSYSYKAMIMKGDY